MAGYFKPAQSKPVPQDDANFSDANLNYVAAYEADGSIVDEYHKHHLVPFGEYVPLRSFIERLDDELPSKDVRPGPADRKAKVQTSLGALGISISWEIFFSHRARSAIGDGDGLILLNPTNGSSYWLTILQSQQIATSRLRAIETGRWVVQAAPTGFSAVINPEGNVVERSNISESKVLHADVELRTGDTLTTLLGTWPVAVASAMILAFLLGDWRFLHIQFAHPNRFHPFTTDKSPVQGVAVLSEKPEKAEKH